METTGLTLGPYDLPGRDKRRPSDPDGPYRDDSQARTIGDQTMRITYDAEIDASTSSSARTRRIRPTASTLHLRSLWIWTLKVGSLASRFSTCGRTLVRTRSRQLPSICRHVRGLTDREAPEEPAQRFTFPTGRSNLWLFGHHERSALCLAGSGPTRRPAFAM